MNIRAGAATVDFASGWDHLWGAVQGIISGQASFLLTGIGVALLVGALVKYIFDKRRGGGMAQGLQAVLWTALIGALLASPNLIIPIALRLLDWAINTGIAFFNSTSGSSTGN